MYDVVLLLGAPGSGKTTIGHTLKELLGSPCIDFDRLRSMHLRLDWSDASDVERDMALDNLLHIIRNYLSHGYRNAIVVGPREYNVDRLRRELAEARMLVATLFLTDEEELRRRVLTESRDGGWRDAEASIRLNRRLLDELSFAGEQKVDATHASPIAIAVQIATLFAD